MTTLNNEKVRKNLKILKRLIDCVVFLRQQALPLKDNSGILNIEALFLSRMK